MGIAGKEPRKSAGKNLRAAPACGFDKGEFVKTPCSLGFGINNTGCYGGNKNL